MFPVFRGTDTGIIPEELQETSLFSNLDSSLLEDTIGKQREEIEEIMVSFSPPISVGDILDTIEDCPEGIRQLPSQKSYKRKDRDFSAKVCENLHIIFPSSYVKAEKKQQKKIKRFIKLIKGQGVSIGPVLSLGREIYFNGFIDIFQVLSKFFFMFPKNEKLVLLMQWYERKHINTVTDEATVFYSRVYLESAEFFLSLMEGEDTILGLLDFSEYKEHIELLILFHNAVHSASSCGFKSEEIDKITAGFSHIADRYEEIKRKHPKGIGTATFEKIIGKNVSKKELEIFLNSPLHEALFLGRLVIHDEQKGEVPLPVSTQKARILTLLYFRGAKILGDPDFLQKTSFMINFLLKEDIEESRLGGILNLLISHRKNDVILSSLLTLNLEGMACLRDINAQQAMLLRDRFTDMTPEGGGLPRPRLNLDFLMDLSSLDFARVISLDDRHIEHLSKHPSDTREMLAIDSLVIKMQADILWLHASHPSYTDMKAFIDDVYILDHLGSNIVAQYAEVYKNGDIDAYIRLHKSLARGQEENRETVVSRCSTLHAHMGHICSETAQAFSREYFTLANEKRQRCDTFLAAIGTESQVARELTGELGSFLDFFADQDSTWTTPAEEMYAYYREYHSGNENSPVGSTERVQEEISIKERIIHVYGEDFGFELLERFSCADSLDILASIGEKLETYMQQIFVVFIIEQELDAEILSQKGYILESIIIFFKHHKIRNLHTTEKLFDFCWAIEDISEIQVLYSFFPFDSRTKIDYKDFLDVVMRYLKRRDVSVLEDFFLDEEEKEEKQERYEKPEGTKKIKRRASRNAYYNPDNVFLSPDSLKKINEIRKWRNRAEIIAGLQALLDGDESYQNQVYIAALGRYKIYAIQYDGSYSSHLGSHELERLEAKLIQKRNELSSQDICGLMENISVLDTTEMSSNFWPNIGNILRSNETDLDAEQICRILYSFLFIPAELLPDNIMGYILQKLEKVDITYPGDIAKALYGLYPHRNSHNGDMKRLLDTLFYLLGRNKILLPESSEDDSTIITIKRVYSLFGRNIPSEYENEYQGMLGEYNFDHKNISSSIERKIYLTIKKYFPDAIHGHYISGFESDIFIPSLNLNIEVDGPHHIGIQILKDQKRDEYLGNWGVSIHRFHLVRKTEKEILKEVEQYAKGMFSYTSLKS